MTMNDRIIGRVKRVNGPVIEVMGITDAEMFELVRVGEENLVGELIKLETDSAVVQVTVRWPVALVVMALNASSSLPGEVQAPGHLAVEGISGARLARAIAAVSTVAAAHPAQQPKTAPAQAADPCTICSPGLQPRCTSAAESPPRTGSSRLARAML